MYAASQSATAIAEDVDKLISFSVNMTKLVAEDTAKFINCLIL